MAFSFFFAEIELTYRKLRILRQSSITVLGNVRLQKRQIESELKVRQKGRVPPRFDTRLWPYGLHERVQSEAFRFIIWSLNEELRVQILNMVKCA